MATQILWIILAAAGGPDPQPPAGMVLAVTGEVTLRRGDAAPRPLRVMDLVYAGDALRADGGEAITLVVLSDGHKETVRGAAEVKITAEGGVPAEKVRREPGKLSPAHLAGLRKLSQSDRGGVVVPRGLDADPATVATRRPLSGATVLTERPDLSWGAGKPAPFGYRVSLFRITELGLDEPVWNAETREPKLGYPASEAPLKRGACYRWSVVAPQGGGREATLVNSRFCVATEEVVAQAKALERLAEAKSPEEWVLAATAYDTLGLYDRALAQFRGLAEAFPKEPRYLEAVAAYHERAGDLAAAQRAKELSGDK